MKKLLNKINFKTYFKSNKTRSARTSTLKRKDLLAKTIIKIFAISCTLLLAWIIGYILYKGTVYNKITVTNFLPEKTKAIQIESTDRNESAEIAIIVNKKVKTDNINLEQLNTYFTSRRTPKWGFITEQNLNASLFTTKKLPEYIEDYITNGTGFGKKVNYTETDKEVIEQVAASKGGLGIILNKNVNLAAENRKVKVLYTYVNAIIPAGNFKTTPKYTFAEISQIIQENRLSEYGLTISSYREIPQDISPVEIEQSKRTWILTPDFIFRAPARSGKWGGISVIILNTLLLVLFTIIFSVPIGMGAAIYLTQYAKEGIVTRIIRLGVETLAGIPSIVLGLFGHVFFVRICGFDLGFLSAILTITIMILPTIVRTMEEALKTVPNSYREGSYALGAGKIPTVFKVIVPSASTGIITGIILAIGRVVSETAVLLYTLGSSYQLVSGPKSSARVLSQHLYLLFSEAISFEKAFGTAAVLIIIILLINLAANKVIKKMSRMQID